MLLGKPFRGQVGGASREGRDLIPPSGLDVERGVPRWGGWGRAANSAAAMATTTTAGQDVAAIGPPPPLHPKCFENINNLEELREP